MKKYSIFIFLFSLIIFVMIVVFVIFGKKVDLCVGIIIMFELLEILIFDQMIIGKFVKFKVIIDVVVDGRVVICIGVFVWGCIKSIDKAIYNNFVQFYIEVQYVQFVDGQ